MKGLTFGGARAIRYESVPEPTIEDPADAIVDVLCTAICGSDLHVYHERERGLDHGTIMGHEFVGTVVEVGTAVRGITVGSRVACPFTTSCGNCFYCRSGLTARCEHGALFGWVEQGRGLHGVQAERVRVPLADGTLVPVPEGIETEEALLAGDVLSTGFYCAARGDIDRETTVAVIGCGPVGLMGLIGAIERGATRIVAIDGVPERLARAREFGVAVVDYTVDDPLEAVRDLSHGRGADVVLELVGSPDAMRSAYRLVRPGGVISVVGVHTAPQFSFSPAEAYDKNLTLRVGRCPARRMMQDLLPWLERQRYDLLSVISHRMPLARGAEAYDLFDRRADGCTKVLLTP